MNKVPRRASDTFTGGRRHSHRDLTAALPRAPSVKPITSVTGPTTVRSFSGLSPTRVESKQVQVDLEPELIRALRAEVNEKMKVVTDYEFVLKTEVNRRRKIEQQLSDLRAAGCISEGSPVSVAPPSPLLSRCSSSSASAASPPLVSSVAQQELRVQVDSLRKEMVHREASHRQRVEGLEDELAASRRSLRASDAQLDAQERKREAIEDGARRQRELCSLQGRVQTLEGELAQREREIAEAKRKNVLLMEEHTKYQKQSELEKGYLRDKLRDTEQKHIELKSQLLAITKARVV